MTRRWLSLRAELWGFLALLGDILRDFCDWTDQRSRDALDDWFRAEEDQ